MFSQTLLILALIPTIYGLPQDPVGPDGPDCSYNGIKGKCVAVDKNGFNVPDCREESGFFMTNICPSPVIPNPVLDELICSGNVVSRILSATAKRAVLRESVCLLILIVRTGRIMMNNVLSYRVYHNKM